MRENHYAILARLKISYVLKSQDKHNASYFSKMSWSGKTFPSAKLTKIFENERIGEKKFQITKLPTLHSRHGEGESIEVAVAGTIPYIKASLDPTDSWCLSSLYESSYAIEAERRRLKAPFTKARWRCRNSINNYDFFLKNLPIQAANIGPKIPAIAPAKPMITYSCQPLNQFRPNIRFSI